MNLSNYTDIIRNLDLATERTALPENLLIDSEGPLSVYYSPFDYINEKASVVICGITPGLYQAIQALKVAREKLLEGAPVTDAAQAAKNVASFSGPMRTNLVRMLDAIGLAHVMGIKTTSELFSEYSGRAHFTSALRYPVFKDGKNYSGTPVMLRTPILRKQIDTSLAEEIRCVSPGAFYVPLGPKVEAALHYFVQRGELSSGQVLDGLPHPSGANAERIAYFLGDKHRNALSNKTNPEKIDNARERLVEKVRGKR